MNWSWAEAIVTFSIGSWSVMFTGAAVGSVVKLEPDDPTVGVSAGVTPSSRFAVMPPSGCHQPPFGDQVKLIWLLVMRSTTPLSQGSQAVTLKEIVAPGYGPSELSRVIVVWFSGPNASLNTVPLPLMVTVPCRSAVGIGARVPP